MIVKKLSRETKKRAEHFDEKVMRTVSEVLKLTGEEEEQLINCVFNTREIYPHGLTQFGKLVRLFGSYMKLISL